MNEEWNGRREWRAREKKNGACANTPEILG